MNALRIAATRAAIAGRSGCKLAAFSQPRVLGKCRTEC
jgi:hypothetical protein